MRSFLMIFVSVLAAIVGQLCMKQGMMQVGPMEMKSRQEILMAAQRVFSKPLVLAGLTCYAVGALAWLFVLSRLDLRVRKSITSRVWRGFPWKNEGQCGNLFFCEPLASRTRCWH